LATSSRRGKIEKKGKRTPERAAARSSLVLAELSYQRGDISKALLLLKRLRLKSRKPGFKEENLYGCSQCLSLELQESIRVFEKLSRKHKNSGLFYEKARFNLGLVHLYQDLITVGDLSVTHQTMSGHNLFTPGLVTSGQFEKAFTRSIDIWEDLLPSAKHYKNIVLAFLAFACLQKGDLEQALSYVLESHALSRNFYISDYVTGRIFLDFYFLTEDQISFSLEPDVMEFFGIDKEDVVAPQGSRFQLFPDAYIRVAHDAFFEAHLKNQHSPEVMIGLIICYFYFGQSDELQKYLTMLEGIVPQSRALLDTVFWLVRESAGSPNEIKTVLDRLMEMNDTLARNQIFQIIAPYFLI
jgi:tetratricopeptide (TPR) repeat protein